MKTDNINKQKLIEYYKETKNALRVGEKFGISAPTVLKIVRSFNVPVYNEHKKYTDEYVISCYMELGTVQRVADEIGMSDYRINKILDNNNIERKTLNRIQSGDVYGKLTIIDFVGYYNNTHTKVYLCKCECGGTREVRGNKLGVKEKTIVDCGCGWKLKRNNAELKRREKEHNRQIRLEKIEENKRKREKEKLNKKPPTETKYVVGYKHHRLTIISEIGTGNDKVFTVQCECGTTKEIKRKSITYSKSCGCLQREKSTTHGMSSKNKKWYDRWRGMIKRCYNSKCRAYPNYGGRGIQVCDRWREPNGVGCKNYIDDIHNILGPQPGPNYSLDRIDNDGNYEISNLRWATLSVQAKNQRRNKKSGNSD